MIAAWPQQATPPGERPLGPPAAAAKGAGAIALLGAEGFSAGLGLGLLVIGPQRAAAYVTTNALAPDARRMLLLLAAGLAVAAMLAGGLVLRRDGLLRLVGAARRLSPLLLAALVPALLNWRAWPDHELHFLALATVCVLATEALVRIALGAPPLFGRSGRGPQAMAAVAAALRARAWWPLAAVCAGAAAYALYFGFHTVAYHRNVFTRSFDLGLEANAVWNAFHGGPLLKSSPFAGPDSSLIGYHAVFWAYLLGPLYALAPRAETLLVLQALLAAGAGVLLFAWSRPRIGAERAALVTACYFLYPPLHGANLYDFHYQTLAPFALWLTLWAVESRRDVVAAVAVAATLALREDVAASLAVLGLYLVLSGARPRAGAVIAAVSAAYFVSLKFFVMPAAEPDPSFLYAFAGLLPPGGRSFEAVLQTVAGNPVFTVGTLLTREKLVYTLQLLVPLAFLPLRRPLGWLFLLPGFFFTLLSTGYAPFTQISFQYTAHWTGFLFPALVLALARLGEEPAGGVRLRAAAAALVIGTLAVSHQYGAVLQRTTARSGFDPFFFGTGEADRLRRAELYALIALVPPRAKVAGSETVVPHVASRPDAYTLRLGLYDAEYLLFSVVPSAPGELERAAAALADGSFGVVDARSLFVLCRRGHDTAGNPAVLARIARSLPPAAAAPPGR